MPIYKQPYYHMKNSNMKLEASEKYYDTSFSLPLFPSLLKKQINLVIKRVHSAYERGL